MTDEVKAMRCAECDCESGGADCNWIKPGPDAWPKTEDGMNDMSLPTMLRMTRREARREALEEAESVTPIDDLCEGWCESPEQMGTFSDCTACAIKRGIRAAIEKGA